MIYIKNLLCFIAVVLVIALGFLLFPALQDNAGAICIVDIEKVAVPSDGTDFNFTCTGGGGGNCSGDPEFTLMDGDSEDMTINAGDSITVVELVPEGWELANIRCGASDSNITFELNAIRNGVRISCTAETSLVFRECTFRNIKTPRPIPTISEWGLIAMAGILGVIGFIAIRRRKVTV